MTLFHARQWPLPARDRVGNLDQVASIVESTVGNGPASGARAIDIRPMGGIDIRVLPDRGCDIGAAWFRGIPLTWISPVGERAPFAPPSGEQWLDAFGGGLVTTCGLRNVGPPSEGVGLHGVFSHQRARILGVERRQDGESITANVRAVVSDASHASWCLELQRQITTRAGEGHLEIVDITRNLGAFPEPCPILYHVNVGAPLWDTGARLEIRGSRNVAPDPGCEADVTAWASPPVPEAAKERGFEHAIEPGADGCAEARVISEQVGIEFVLRWDAGTLPRFHQWVQPAPGVYALGLEPTNCSVFGRAHDRAEGRLPVLEPGGERITRLEIRVDVLSGDW